jgi:6,7-dimethyl-8-ribityllumazine synthase
MYDDAHVLIVEADFYRDISDALLDGAKSVLDATDGVTHDVVQVPGCLEIPGAIRFAIKSMDLMGGRRRYDAYIALGCVVRGETSHYDTVSEESARGLMDLSLLYSIAVGNGIITCENMDQAWARAKKDDKNKGGGAAEAALKMLNLKKLFGLFPR